jgi:hypothetical protein
MGGLLAAAAMTGLTPKSQDGRHNAMAGISGKSPPPPAVNLLENPRLLEKVRRPAPEPGSSDAAGSPSPVAEEVATMGANCDSLPAKASDRRIGSERLSSKAARGARSIAPTSALRPARIGTADSAAPQTSSRMPAVLVGADPAKPLPEEVEKAIDKMAEDFAKTMEESGLEPCDPEYAKLWQQAVEVSDREFRARYGKQAWMRQHLEAHRMQDDMSGD